MISQSYISWIPRLRFIFSEISPKWMVCNSNKDPNQSNLESYLNESLESDVRPNHRNNQLIEHYMISQVQPSYILPINSI